MSRTSNKQLKQKVIAAVKRNLESKAFQQSLNDCAEVVFDNILDAANEVSTGLLPDEWFEEHDSIHPNDEEWAYNYVLRATLHGLLTKLHKIADA